jgi:uncharacterized membrane protein (TIGR02234 family)
VSRRATFGPVVLFGLVAAALAAVAGNKTWTEVDGPGGDCRSQVPPGVSWSELAQGAPLAGALGLVVLAAWGVILVTRARTRRLMALLAAVAAGGYLATAVSAYWMLKDAARDKARDRVGQLPDGCDVLTVHMNNTWWLVALVAGAVGIVAALAAVALAPDWPEMGSKYDAPSTGAAPAAAPLDEQSSTDLWKSLDAGHDPTAGPDADDHPRA